MYIKHDVNYIIFIGFNLSAHWVCVYLLSINLLLTMVGREKSHHIMSIKSGLYKIISVKENGPLTYSPPTDSLAVKGEPGTTVCSMSSNFLPAVDCILVVLLFEGQGLGRIHNSDAQRIHLCTH